MTGAPGGPVGPAPRTARVLDAVTMAGGLLCLAIGAAVGVAWLVRATAVLRFGDPYPMVFNTALALAVTGAALALEAVGRWPRAVLVAGVLDTALGLLSLAEALLGRGLGIDQLLVRDYLNVAGFPPGRVAGEAAVCWIVVGLGLLAWAPWRPRPRPVAIAAAGSLTSVIAIVAIFGYASSGFHAYYWGRLSSMAVFAAAALLVLGMSLQCGAVRGTTHAGLLRWLPVHAGLTALGLAAGVSLAVIGRSSHSGRVPTGVATSGALAIGLLTAALVALSVWLAQRAETGRQLALAEAAHRAEAEAQARAGEQRMFRFLEAMPVAVFVDLPDGGPYYANQEAVRILGRGVMPGMTTDRIPEAYGVFVAGTGRPYPTEDLPVAHAARGQQRHVDDMDIHQPDGSVTPIEVWGAPIAGPDGQVEYAMIVFADISERKAREQTIASQAALLDLARDAIVALDVDDRITYWNTGAERTYGFARSDAIGRVARELLHTRFPGPLLPEIEAAVTGQGHWEGELEQRCADGRVIVVESRWAAQRDPDGRLTGYLKVNRDITARKAAERELNGKSAELQALAATLELQVQQRTAHLERVNKDLEMFAYSVAHDLRTPLRGLSGFAEVLVEDYSGRLDEVGREYAERIRSASQKMAVLIDDLLQLARVTRSEIHLEPVDLSQEAADIADEVRAGYPGRQVRVTVEPGILVTADRILIRIALRNLFDNAWKFTARSADARVEFGAARAGDGAIGYFVRDNGAGFDPAYAGKLFQPFQRLHSVTEFPGSGIGLASVRQIVERHGGRVWAEGTHGGGAIFHFTLDATIVPGRRDSPNAVPSDRP